MVHDALLSRRIKSSREAVGYTTGANPKANGIIWYYDVSNFPTAKEFWRFSFSMCVRQYNRMGGCARHISKACGTVEICFLGCLNVHPIV